MAKTRSLNAVTGTGAGTGFLWAQAKATVSLTVLTSGSPTSGTVALEVSNDDGATWTSVATFVVGTNTVGKPVVYDDTAVRGARANCTVAPGGGSSPTLTAHVVGA